jgi:hypothetical protein
MTKKTTRTRAEAKTLMWEYYRENKEALSKSVRECREEILEDLISGQNVRNVFTARANFVRCGTVS